MSISRVLGEFPNDADETLCARSWLKLAAQRWEEWKDHGSVVVSVDAARYGADESVAEPLV